MNFDLNKIYFARLSPLTFASLSNIEITENLRDARNTSAFYEIYVDANFNNISRIKGNKSCDFSYNDNPNNKLELRTFSLKTELALLIPSNQIGAGRKYDPDGYNNKLNSILGYLIVHPIIDYQNILIFGITRDKIINSGKLIKQIRKPFVEKYLNMSPKDIYNHSNNSKILIKQNIIYEYDKDTKGFLSV